MERVESPCERNCCLDTDDICMGCFRSIDEITGWEAAANDERREILKRAEARREVKRAQRGKWP